MDEQKMPPLTPDDWRKATDQVIKLSERVEAAVPTPHVREQKVEDWPSRSK